MPSWASNRLRRRAGSPKARNPRGINAKQRKSGGRDRDRTGDLLIANSGENKLRQGATIT